jgi:hypothetical protein
MQATIMHFAIYLPDWNSLDSVRRTHSDLEGAALVFFALLVGCDALAHLSDDKKKERWFSKIGIVFFAIAVLAEIVAYPYGLRNDTLSEQVIVSLDAKARDAASNASTALSNSKEAETKSSDAVDKAGKAQIKVDAVAKQAEEIDADLARTQYLLSSRSVTDPDSLVKQLNQYKGQTIHFGSYNSEPDESLLCGQLAAAARLAEMNVPQDFCGRYVVVGTPLTGIVISGPDIPQTLALSQIILQTLNVGAGGVVSGIKAPELTILVGAKPPFMIGQARGVKVPTKKQTKKPNAKP